MSVIVKGMKMPENCRECPFENYHSDIGQTVCMASLRVLAMGFKTMSFDGRHSSCPLVALPDKHGELIDRQKLIEDNKHLEYPTDGKYRRDRAWVVGFNAGARHCNEHAVYAKTVIEAEGEE